MQTGNFKKSQETLLRGTGSKLASKSLFFALLSLTLITSHTAKAQTIIHEGYEVEPMSSVPKYPGSLSGRIGALFTFPSWKAPKKDYAISPTFKNIYSKRIDLNRSEAGFNLSIKNFSFEAKNPGVFINFSTTHTLGSEFVKKDVEPYYYANAKIDIQYLHNFIKMNFGVDGSQASSRSDNQDKTPKKAQNKDSHVVFQSSIAMKQEENTSIHLESDYHRMFASSYSKPSLSFIRNWLLLNMDFTKLEQNLKIGPLFYHGQSFASETESIQEELKTKSIMLDYTISPVKNIWFNLATNYVIHSNEEKQGDLRSQLLASYYNSDSDIFHYNNEDSLNIDMSLELIKIFKNIDLKLKYQNQIQNMTKKNIAKRSYRENYEAQVKYSVAF